MKNTNWQSNLHDNDVPFTVSKYKGKIPKHFHIIKNKFSPLQEESKIVCPHWDTTKMTYQPIKMQNGEKVAWQMTSQLQYKIKNTINENEYIHHIVIKNKNEIEVIHHINNLTDSDIGKYVEYNDNNGKVERGKIKSYNNETQLAWVVYKCNNEWNNYQNYTGQSIKYEDLIM